MRSSDPRTAFCRRLRDARIAAGLSQKQLGIKAGLDEFVASTRINRYEVGVHEPDVGTTRRLASVLGVPLPYFYTDDDLMAEMILAFTRIPRRKQQAPLRELDGKASRNQRVRSCNATFIGITSRHVSPATHLVPPRALSRDGAWQCARRHLSQ